VSVVLEILNGSLPASILAKELGLKPDYFSNVRDDSLNKEVKVYRFKHTVLVRLPKDAYEMLKTHTAVVLNKDDNEKDFDYILHLTSRIKIGFWK